MSVAGETRIRTRLRHVDAWLRRAIDGVAALLLLAVTSLGIAQVVARYAFNASLVWSEEGIRLLYVWLVLIAASTAPHMRIGLFADRARGGLAVALGVLRGVVVIALLALLVDGALTLEASFGSDRYVALGISKGWYWSAAIVGATLWAGATLSALLARRSDERTSRESPPP